MVTKATPIDVVYLRDHRHPGSRQDRPIGIASEGGAP